jgi:hypothetical protein
MTFSEAYALYGPDVEQMAQAMGIDPPAADRLINDKLNRRYRDRQENARIRSELGEIRARAVA